MSTSPTHPSPTVLPAWLAAIPTALGRDLWLASSERRIGERVRSLAGTGENAVRKPSPRIVNDP